MTRLKHLMLALVIACTAAAGSVTLSGQRGLPSCDPDNGGLTLPAGFCALVVHPGCRRRPSHRRQRQRRHLRHSAARAGPEPAGQLRQPGGIVGLRDTNGDGKADMVTREVR